MIKAGVKAGGLNIKLAGLYKIESVQQKFA